MNVQMGGAEKSGSDSDSKTPPPRVPILKPAQLSPPQKTKVASRKNATDENATYQDATNQDALVQSSSFAIDVSKSEEDLRLSDRLKRSRKSLGSLAISFFVHALWLAMLLYLTLSTELGPRPISITASFESEPTESPLELSTPSVTITEVVDPADSPTEDSEENLADAIEPTAAEIETVALPAVDVSPIIPTAAPETEASSTKVVAPARITGGGIEGRDAKSRAAIAASRGGTPESEQAVEAGISWIVEHQNRYDGGWSFQHSCGKCGDDGSSQSDNAATGLSLMALLGAGYTHREGPYQQSVQMGLESLLRFQEKRKSEFGGPFIDVSGAGMYTHAIATIAIADAYAMTKDEKLKQPLELAHQYILNAQHRKGGWRYRPNTPGDMLVTGWQVMALKSLERCGIETPPEVYQRTIEFVESLAVSGGAEYRYELKEKNSRDVPTAVGLLNQMYLHWSRDHEGLDRGAGNLVDRRVSKDDIYFNFYTTLLLHHLQHEAWEDWNSQVQHHLIRTQSTRGHEAGSWHFSHVHGNVGGRLYTTAMAVMTLEVYYRYSPLFGSQDVSKEVFDTTKER